MRVYQFRHQGKPMGAVHLVEGPRLVNAPALDRPAPPPLLDSRSRKALEAKQIEPGEPF